MNKKGLLAGMICLCATSFAGADEISDLKKEVSELQKKIANIESIQNNQQGTIEAAVKDAVQEGTTPDALKWAEKIKFYGDFRLRYDSMDKEKDSYVRERARIRARLGLTAEVNEEVSFDLRLATGGTSADSGNQTLGDYNEKKAIMIDRAYITYKPESIDGLKVKGGKFGVPFYAPGGNQLIWDGDLNLEGAAIAYESGPLFVNVGGFMLSDERDTADAGLYGAQAGLKLDIAGNKATIGASSYNYSQADIDADGIDEQCKMIDVFADYSFKLSDNPVTVYGDYVTNTEADSDDTGYLVGVKYGKAKAPGTWAVGYEYMDVAANAVYDSFNDSDFLDASYGTGHKFSMSYALLKNTSFAVTYLLGTYDSQLGYGEDDGFSRLMADFKFKF